MGLLDDLVQDVIATYLILPTVHSLSGTHT